MNRPVTIGIGDLSPSDHHDLFQSPYLRSLEGVGAQYRVLTWTDDPMIIRGYVTDSDGILLPGGDDVEPDLYGEKRLPECGSSIHDRDRFEISLIREAVKQNKPVFGICRGLQIMNVFRGGTLWQDIPSQRTDAPLHPIAQHGQMPVRLHSVRIVPGTNLAEVLNTDTLNVNSAHHQGIKVLGEGLIASAFSEDGIIEAFESPDGPFFCAVQWHPEWLYPSVDATALLREFVETCRRSSDEL